MSIRKTEHVRLALGRLNTRGCKVGAIAILFVLMATATAAVFSMDYATATATVQTPDIVLVAGSDSSSTPPSTYPAAHVDVSTTNYATIELSMFPSVTESLQPATYYTDLLEILNNGGQSHQIESVKISDIGLTTASASTAALLATGGSITVYYCTTQTNDPANSHVGSFTITSATTAGGSFVNSVGDDMPAQTIGAYNAADLSTCTDYIEVVAHAADGATVANSVSFAISIQWA